MADRSLPDLTEWLATQRELTLLMAHDLRNPLAAMLANLNFLELAVTSDDSEVLEAVGDLKLSAEVLLRLVENLVTIARLEARGQLDPDDAAPVDVAAAARNAFARARPAAESAGVQAELVAPDEPVWVRGDATMVEQLVENLLGNATQHVRRGQRARIAVATEGDRVTIALDDDGPAFGGPERDFSREGQLELKKKSDARYSRGLALYVVGLVARALGGQVAVRDDDGRGHVQVTLPRAEPPAE